MMIKKLFCLCMILSVALPFAACGSKTNEQDTPQVNDSEQAVSNALTTQDDNSTNGSIPPPTEIQDTPVIPFTDVTEDVYYYDAVKWAYENSIVSDASTFEPNSACTRGQVITFLWRGAGSPEPQTTENPFSDISSSDWYYTSALWAYENGVATGAAFSPNNPCTEAETLTFLWRAEGKPAAVVDNSGMALAASGQYYARAVAWAEINGLFSESNEFDPAALCSRADLITYLYWAEEQWALSRGDKTIQAEYEQIIAESPLYEIEGKGLCYADYIDIEGDGDMELLTLDLRLKEYDEDDEIGTVTATVYGNLNGHVVVYCEKTFPLDILFEYALSTYKYDDNMFISCEAVYPWRLRPSNIEFYRIENDSFVLSEQLRTEEEPYVDLYYYVGDTEITGEEYYAMIEKYTDGKELLSLSYEDMSFERGILPDKAEYWANYWTDYWVASDPMYTAVLSGDFSTFVGNYTAEIGWYVDTLTMAQDGVLTDAGDYVTDQKPISISISEDGTIRCILPSTEDEAGYLTTYYTIYPVGIALEYYLEDYEDDTGKVRIWYQYPSHGLSDDIFIKVS